MISYSPSSISSPVQSSSSSLLPARETCRQETHSYSQTQLCHQQQRQHLPQYQYQHHYHGFQQVNELPSMPNTISSSSPPTLTVFSEENGRVTTAATTVGTTDGPLNSVNISSHQPHHHHQPHTRFPSNQQQYSKSMSSCNTGYAPITPPASQQDVVVTDQSSISSSYYDPYPSSNQEQHSYQQSHVRQSPTIATMESNHRASTSSLMPNQQKKHLRFHIVLQANTAVTQKTEESTLTYLNRGQSYGIQLTDKLGHDSLIQSQFVIMFHDPSHRKIALNYWKFWIGQQKDPQHARAVDLDPGQSIGIMNVRFPSFDRIAFDWHGRHGAKLFVRFNCLSTDFSRIKGVKGIPLRACMASQISTTTDPLLMRQYAGTFHPIHKDHPAFDYLEQSFCKIKLFRDKGAERKNKDDAKQLGKQFDKMMHEGDPRHHPMWLIYNASVPYSVFDEIPTCPPLDSFERTAADGIPPPSNISSHMLPMVVSSLPVTDSIKLSKDFPPLKLDNSSANMSPGLINKGDLTIQPSLPIPFQYQRAPNHHHQHHHHPYAKRPPLSLSSNSTTSSTSFAPGSLSPHVATVPTQLFPGGLDSLLPNV